MVMPNFLPILSRVRLGVHGGLVVSVIDCKPRGGVWGSNSGQGRNLDRSRFLLHLRPLANSAMMSTLIAHCQWEDETVRERIGHPPSDAVAKKMKSLTLHTYGCLRASLRD